MDKQRKKYQIKKIIRKTKKTGDRCNEILTERKRKEVSMGMAEAI